MGPSKYELRLSEPEIVAWLEAEEPEDGDEDEALHARSSATARG